MIERFIYRKQGNLTTKTDFLNLKGAVGQVDMPHADPSHPNPDVGFKCLKYSVMESSGTISITIVKKNMDKNFTFGWRTIDGEGNNAAIAPEYYTHVE